METISFECGVVTPMFLGGADQQAELRPPSIRGSIRWWFRAMNGNANFALLRNSESEAFGSTNAASSFSLVIKQTDVDTEDDLKATGIDWGFDPVRKRPIQKKGKYGAGIAYLLFAALQNERNFILPGGRFSLSLGFGKVGKADDVIKSLWLLVNVGAVGLRSRRGAGGVVVVDKPAMTNSLASQLADATPNFVFEGSSAVELKDFLNSGIGRCVPAKSSTKDYSVLSGSSIHIIDASFSSWMEALDRVGTLYENYRFINRKNVFDGPNFGLPVDHKGKPNMRLRARYPGGKLIERRSSPLIFKVWTNRNLSTFFAGVIHLSQANLTPSGTILQQTQYRDPATGRKSWVDGSAMAAKTSVVSAFISTLGDCQTINIA